MTSLNEPPSAVPSPIDCATAVRRLWDYVDGRLSAIAHDELEAHLATCENCPPHFRCAQRMQRSLAATALPPISEEDETRLRDRVRRTLGNSDARRG